jgi:hypothetical protein
MFSGIDLKRSAKEPIKTVNAIECPHCSEGVKLSPESYGRISGSPVVVYSKECEGCGEEFYYSFELKVHITSYREVNLIP